ncbi:MAG: polysaccharide pyruvyl transferase family protein [Defluviitaleaceae bacterium]|nr:polysaccharide pyruvyl transferase family protein [Defluviitaleaceae bacterium]
MENKFTVEAIVQNTHRISYRYRIEGDWIKYFRTEENWNNTELSPFWGKVFPSFEWMYYEYSVDIGNVPYSIAILPLLSNIVPMAWLFDAKIHVDEVDDTFYHALDSLLNGFKKYKPKWFEHTNRGNSCIYTKNIIQNQNSVQTVSFFNIFRAKKSLKKTNALVMFSGGVDAWDTLIDTIHLKPDLLTIWGCDIYPNNIKGWEVASAANKEVADSLGLNFFHIKSNFRSIINYGVINAHMKYLHPGFDNYWYNIQSRVSCLGMAAPFSYAKDIRIVFIGSSYSLEDGINSFSGSNPLTDENVKFSNTFTVHKSFQKSRNEKIRNIISWAEKNKQSPVLRVCWQSNGGQNCCVCEKCVRTWVSILSEGADLAKYGFDLTQDKVKKAHEALLSNAIKITKFWDATIANFKANPELSQGQHPLVKEMIDKLTGKLVTTFVHPITQQAAVEKIKLQDGMAYLGFSTEPPADLNDKFVWAGNNSGNLIFDHSIKKIINAELIPMNKRSDYIIDDCKAIITTGFIWILPNDPKATAWHKHLLNYAKDKPLIPISVGLQAHVFSPDFKIHEDTVNVLSAMAERCVLGVRGYYAANILNKHGIKNIKVIGCPSVYFGLDAGLGIKNIAQPKICCSNFRAFHGKLKDHEKKFLKYCASKDFTFVEQNQQTLEAGMSNADDYQLLKKWLDKKSEIFFSAEEWVNCMRSFDFNIGYRFHANVAALHAGIPSLFFSVDSRVTEMCEFFNLPLMSPSDFDPNKDIQYYAELADYTEFNKNYGNILNNFKEFCASNGITLNL